LTPVKTRAGFWLRSINQFVISPKTAGTLGLSFSLPLLARADEVIE
jgi:hypothetical protein